MKYELTQQGNHWIGTDGERVVEGVDAVDALSKLELVSEFGMDEHDIDRDSLKINTARSLKLGALRLIELVVLGAPANILRDALRVMSKRVEELAQLHEED